MTLIRVRALMTGIVAGASALALIALTGGSASAQGRGRPEQRPRIMIATFQSADRELGMQAAEGLRNRVTRDVGERGPLHVVPKTDIHNTLEASGYSVSEALSPNDAKTLAGQVRAEEYVDGVVTRTPTGIRMETRLVLARDNTVTQVLTPVEGARLDQAVAQVSRELLQAHRQIEQANACTGALRANDPPRAIREAERGLQLHAKYNNMIRVCLASAYVQRDTPRDSTSVVSAQTLQLVEQVLASDPRNIQALKIAAIGYKAAGNEDRYVQTLTALVAADPSDLRLQDQVVNSLAESGRASLAVPIIVDALQNNPGDPRMLRTAWLVLLAARDFQRAVGIGEELVRVDTAAATADFFRRLAAAYRSANRVNDAVQALERGTARFPNDAALLALSAQILRESGQAQRAVEMARRAVSIDASSSDARVQLVQALVATGQADAAAIAIREAASAGVNRTLLSQLALSLGNNAYRAGQAAAREPGQTANARVEFERAVRLLRLSNEMEPNVNAQFLLGASAFSLGDALTRQAQANRDCQATRSAQELFVLARPNLEAGRSAFPEPARQLLDAIGQFTTPLTQMVRAYCRR